MPYETRVRTGGYAVIRGFGLVSAAERREATDLLASDPALVSGMPILIDGRDVVALPSTAETGKIVRIQIQSLPRHPVAFLVQPGAFSGVARQVSVQLEAAGISAEVFSDPEEAHAWIRSRVSPETPDRAAGEVSDDSDDEPQAAVSNRQTLARHEILEAKIPQPCEPYDRLVFREDPDGRPRRWTVLLCEPAGDEWQVTAIRCPKDCRAHRRRH